MQQVGSLMPTEHSALACGLKPSASKISASFHKNRIYGFSKGNLWRFLSLHIQHVKLNGSSLGGWSDQPRIYFPHMWLNIGMVGHREAAVHTLHHCSPLVAWISEWRLLGISFPDQITVWKWDRHTRERCTYISWGWEGTFLHHSSVWVWAHQ